jgi:hypothetical protein
MFLWIEVEYSITFISCEIGPRVQTENDSIYIEQKRRKGKSKANGRKQFKDQTLIRHRSDR